MDPFMRAIVTGQVGVDKGPYLREVSAAARSMGLDLKVCSIGEMMYAEAPDVPPGRILNLPMSRLNSLRRSVFKEVMRFASRHEHVLVNTHATFRWHHGLFAAFDFDQMKEFAADIYVTLLDNAQNVHARLLQDHELEHTLKDIMVWREEEMLATEILAKIARGHGHYYVMGRGRGPASAEAFAKLLFARRMKKVYLSFPMTHVMDQPQTLAQIEAFKADMRRHFVCFDPADVDEFALLAAAEGRERAFDMDTDAGSVRIKPSEVESIKPDIMGQTYARDFKMIDQSDMIVSLVPALPGGKPALSSGVERELQHAFEAGKEVVVIWQAKATASPFVTQTASALFRTPAEAIEHFMKKGYLAAPETRKRAGNSLFDS
jgi:adenylate kinase